MFYMKNRENNWKQYRRWGKVIAVGQLKKPSFYLLLAGILFLLYLTGHIIIPSAENIRVGIYTENSVYGERIKEELLGQRDGLEFVEVSGEEELAQEVYRGTCDCGFLFDETLDDALKSQDLSRSIAYFCSTSTTKGLVAKESVYAALFRCFSEEILKKEADMLFEEAKDDSDGKLVGTVLEYNRNYLSSDEVFRVEFSRGREEESSEGRDAADIQYGVLGLCIFAAALLYGRYRFSLEYGSIGKKLQKKERILLLAARIFIPVLLAGILLQAITGLLEGGQSPKGFFAMIFFCLLSTVWTLLFSALFRREQKYLCSICAVLLMNLVLCPVFFDLSVYIPAVSVIQKILPLYYYCNSM